ncbi:MAG: hypothetical protein JO100_18455 [Pseudonocardia sp.]|nr:hypothetical protein [Pseudonocardia sp.]
MNPQPEPAPAPPLGSLLFSSAMGDIEAAMAGLASLDTVPTAQHVAAFERVHKALSAALMTIDGV